MLVCANAEKIRDLIDKDIANYLKKVFFILGISKQNYPTDIEFLLLVNKTKEYFPTLTGEDLLLAFELAIKGSYEVELRLFDKPFSLLYLTDVLNSYKKYKFDVLKNEKQKQVMLEEKSTLTEFDKEKMLRDGTISYWRRYRDGDIKDFMDICGVKYDFLDGLGLIPFTNERKSAILSEAKEKYKKQLTAKSLNGNPSVREEARKTLKDFSSKNNKEKIKHMAKEMALEIYFADMVEVGEDLEQLINEKEK